MLRSVRGEGWVGLGMALFYGAKSAPRPKGRG
jgi:hypothetical protein